MIRSYGRLFCLIHFLGFRFAVSTRAMETVPDELLIRIFDDSLNDAPHNYFETLANSQSFLCHAWEEKQTAKGLPQRERKLATEEVRHHFDYNLPIQLTLVNKRFNRIFSQMYMNNLSNQSVYLQFLDKAENLVILKELIKGERLEAVGLISALLTLSPLAYISDEQARHFLATPSLSNDHDISTYKSVFGCKSDHINLMSFAMLQLFEKTSHWLEPNDKKYFFYQLFFNALPSTKFKSQFFHHLINNKTTSSIKIHTKECLFRIALDSNLAIDNNGWKFWEIYYKTYLLESKLKKEILVTMNLCTEEEFDQKKKLAEELLKSLENNSSEQINEWLVPNLIQIQDLDQQYLARHILQLLDDKNKASHNHYLTGGYHLHMLNLIVSLLAKKSFSQKSSQEIAEEYQLEGYNTIYQRCADQTIGISKLMVPNTYYLDPAYTFTQNIQLGQTLVTHPTIFLKCILKSLFSSSISSVIENTNSNQACVISDPKAIVFLLKKIFDEADQIKRWHAFAVLHTFNVSQELKSLVAQDAQLFAKMRLELDFYKLDGLDFEKKYSSSSPEIENKIFLAKKIALEKLIPESSRLGFRQKRKKQFLIGIGIAVALIGFYFLVRCMAKPCLKFLARQL